MKIQNITLAGCGVLGSQISLQAAFCGFHVTVWARSEESIVRAKAKLAHFRDLYLMDMETMKTNPAVYYRGFGSQSVYTAVELETMKERIRKACDSLTFTTDLAEACKDADLVMEAIVEDPKQKTGFYQTLAPLMEKNTIVVTNSSTLLPSLFAETTGRPDKYMAFHFANFIWRNNTAECMRHAGTSDETFETILQFAKEINMIPLPVKKETPGYILNSILVPFLDAAETLYVNGVAEPTTIDMTWKLATGSPYGPFQILDIIGLETAYNIKRMDPRSKDPDSTIGKIVAALKEKIDRGETGINAGKGFYDYRKN